LGVARKYSFDTVFAADGATIRAGAGQRSHYSAEEFEAARAAAFEEGRRAERGDADMMAARAIEALAREAGALQASLAGECADLRREAGAIAMAAARQVAGAALDAFGDDRIVEAVEAAMESLRHGPRLIVRVPSNSFNPLRARLEAASQQSAYAGALIVREDPALALGDVAIDWGDGAIALDREALFARIEAILAQRLAEPNAPEDEA
jgi:flagellar assembly protein FliH